MVTSKNISKKSCCTKEPEKRKSHMAPNEAKTTKIVVRCNCGFPNGLYLRGEGIKDLNWDKGVLMKCTKDDEWVWETHTAFTQGQVKVLINDKQYELGENHQVVCGNTLTFAPKFW